MTNKQMLNKMWTEEAGDGRIAMILGLWLIYRERLVNNEITIDNVVSNFIRVVPSKESLVRYHIDSATNMVKNSFKGIKGINHSNDVMDILGIDPYQYQFQDIATNNRYVFIEANRLFYSVVDR